MSSNPIEGRSILKVCYEAGRVRARMGARNRGNGAFDNFQKGRWLEIPITTDQTNDGRIPVKITDQTATANAVISLIRFVTP